MQIFNIQDMKLKFPVKCQINEHINMEAELDKTLRGNGETGGRTE
jgi:hypothetical protein